MQKHARRKYEELLVKIPRRTKNREEQDRSKRNGGGRQLIFKALLLESGRAWHNQGNLKAMEGAMIKLSQRLEIGQVNTSSLGHVNGWTIWSFRLNLCLAGSEHHEGPLQVFRTNEKASGMRGPESICAAP